MAAHVHTADLPADERRQLGRRAQLLAAASVSYNLVEAVVAIAAGLVAGSVALVGFGPDAAVIERALLSQGVVLRPMAGYGLPECLRITVGNASENARLIGAIDACAGGAHG